MLRASSTRRREAHVMLYVGMDLSRKRLDFDARRPGGELQERGAVPPDLDGLARLVGRLGDTEVLAVVESMNGARFVHDQLERFGWDVRIADAVKAKGLAPLACKTDKIDAWVLAILIAHGIPNPSSDLFGAGGRRLLDQLALPDPWRSTTQASLALIDTLDAQIDACERELRSLGADHPYVPLLMSLPGVAWI